MWSSVRFSWGFRYEIVTNKIPTQITRKLRCVIETVVVQYILIVMIDHPGEDWNYNCHNTVHGKFIGDQCRRSSRKVPQKFRLKNQTSLENTEQVHFVTFSLDTLSCFKVEIKQSTHFGLVSPWEILDPPLLLFWNCNVLLLWVSCTLWEAHENLWNVFQNGIICITTLLRYCVKILSAHIPNWKQNKTEWRKSQAEFKLTYRPGARQMLMTPWT